MEEGNRKKRTLGGAKRSKGSNKRNGTRGTQSGKKTEKAKNGNSLSDGLHKRGKRMNSRLG